LTAGSGAVVFLDFDGTITPRDVTDAMLEAFADPAWLQIEEAWVAGRIGSRECLAGQIALVTAAREQVDHLLDEIDVDPGFDALLDACAARAAPVHIVSDGFDYCIRRILERPSLNLVARLAGSQVVSSTLQRDGGRWRASFAHPLEPCAHSCATCKPAAMQRVNATDALTVFVGDGLSDRYAATCADIVFAKDKLAAYCERASIPYAPFDTLAAVADGIDRLLGASRPLPRSLSGKALPTV
jgi:2-hydroxy-3-keto-5-methylthiopentenyl-1-phosphate phosphatase